MVKRSKLSFEHTYSKLASKTWIINVYMNLPPALLHKICAHTGSINARIAVLVE